MLTCIFCWTSPSGNGISKNWEYTKNEQIKAQILKLSIS